MNTELFDSTCRDVAKDATQLLAEAMVAKTDEVIREAVTLFLGNDDWTLESLSGRATMVKLPTGVEIFSLDGVELIELYPVVVDTTMDISGSTHVNATRKHRFLIQQSEGK